MAALAIELVAPARCRVKDLNMSAIYTSRTNKPLALAFWWNRSMRVVDATGTIVPPGPGPVLPCGVAETWLTLMPGHRHQRSEPLTCTQPAGQTATIGWSYKLSPGIYGITLVYEAPPAHGFSQSEQNDYAFVGRVESQQIQIELV